MFEHFDFSLFFKALGLAFALEGVLWAVCTKGMKETMKKAISMEDKELRAMGLVGFGLGILLCFLAM